MKRVFPIKLYIAGKMLSIFYKKVQIEHYKTDM